MKCGSNPSLACSSMMRHSQSDHYYTPQNKSHTRSPPPSPHVEQNPRLRDPSPFPSNNPASQYTLLEKLGTGSFGTVYKALHNDTKQIVAVKQIGKCPCPLSALLSLYILQTSRILMMISQKYSKKSQVLHSAIQNMSPDITVPLS